jgi:hypothetical protein
MRTKPEQYYRALTFWANKFDADKKTLRFSKDEPLRTKEGYQAWMQAASVLSRQKPVSALAWSDKLAMAAKRHCHDQG